MRIFDRYLARQILSSTFFAVAVLSVVLVLGQILKELLDLYVDQKFELGELLKIVGLLFPWTLSYTIPWGLLTAVLLTFGRLSADNELTAMRMAGQSLLRISMPVFVIALLLSGFCFYINTEVAPKSKRAILAMQSGFLTNDPTKLFEPGKVIDQLGSHLVYAERKVGNRLYNFQAVEMNEQLYPPEPKGLLLSEEVEIISLPEQRSIELHLINGTKIMFGKYWRAALDENGRKIVDGEGRPTVFIPELKLVRGLDLDGEPEEFESNFFAQPPGKFRTWNISISLEKLYARGSRTRVDAMTLDELEQTYRASDDELAARRTVVFTGTMPKEILAKKLRAESKTKRSEALTEYNNRFSFSLACLTLALTGICFGITAQRRETSVGFLLSMIVAVCYFAFIMLGQLWKGKPEFHPQILIWLPNVIFGALGIFLFWRLQRR